MTQWPCNNVHELHRLSRWQDRYCDCMSTESKAPDDPDYLVLRSSIRLLLRTTLPQGPRPGPSTANVAVDTGIRLARYKTIPRVPILLPPLPEQRKIAAILSSVDEVIEKTEAVIEQLQVVKKAMMQELLTRGLPGRHTRFKQTEIGEIPEEWEVNGGDLAELRRPGPLRRAIRVDLQDSDFVESQESRYSGSAQRDSPAFSRTASRMSSLRRSYDRLHRG